MFSEVKQGTTLDWNQVDCEKWGFPHKNGT